MDPNEKFRAPYNRLRPWQIRLFRLTLNRDDEPLCGTLLTIIPPELALRKEGLRVTLSSSYVQSAFPHGYDAVSWCWGNSNAERTIRLESLVSKPKGVSRRDHQTVERDDADQVCVTVRENLYEFLLTLRTKKHERLLWIDALCIDQDNDADKTNGLGLMRYIYQFARKVVIWLGHIDYFDKAMSRKIVHVSKALRRCQKRKIDLKHNLCWEQFGVPSPDDEFWAMARLIVTHPWWSRLWTLQEAALARASAPSTNRTIMIGDNSLSWDTLEQFLFALGDTTLDNWVLSGKLFSLPSERHAFAGFDEIKTCREVVVYPTRLQLGGILFGTIRRQASFPLDMVVGQCALLDDTALKELGIGTSSSDMDPSKVVQTFVSFGKYYLQHEPFMCLLNHSVRLTSLEGLPSWCPNFASKEETVSMEPQPARLVPQWHSSRISYERKGPFRTGFHLSGPYRIPYRDFKVESVANFFRGRRMYQGLRGDEDRRSIKVSAHSDSIQVSGLKLDEVLQVIPPNPGVEIEDLLDLAAVKQTSDWIAQCWSLAQLSYAGKKPCTDDSVSFLAQFSNTMTLECTVDGRSEFFMQLPRNAGNVPYNAERAFLDFRDFLRRSLDTDHINGKEYTSLSLDARVFATLLWKMTRRRAFFTTKAGKFGLGPPSTLPGDVINMVFFTPTPYLFRSTNLGHMQLVGEAYVYDFMFGEALRMLDNNQLEETHWDVR